MSLKKITVISHMYPRKNRENYGVFVYEQLAALKKVNPELEITVISPVPYAPKFLASFSKKWQTYLGIESQSRDALGNKTYYPRYLSLPRKVLRSLAARSALYDLGKYQGLDQEIAASDLLIAHTALFDGRLARLMARKYKVPYFVYIHGEDIFQNSKGFLNIVKRFQLSRILGNAKKVITVSSYMKREIERLYSHLGPVVVLPNGVDLGKFKPQKADPKYDLVSTGYLVRRKAYREVVQALAALREDGQTYTLTVAGDGPERLPLMQLIDSLGISERVNFFGPYEHRDLAKILSSAKLFVMPSWDEAFGVVYVEAMAMGLPVIAANDAGARDIVTDGVDGYLVPPHDPEAISEAITTYFALSSSKQEAMAKAAIRKAGRYTWTSNAKNLLEVLSEKSV